MHTSLIDAITLNRQNVEIYTRAYHPCRLLPHRIEDDAFQTPHKLCVPSGSVRFPPEACVLLIQRAKYIWDSTKFCFLMQTVPEFLESNRLQLEWKFRTNTRLCEPWASAILWTTQRQQLSLELVAKHYVCLREHKTMHIYISNNNKISYFHSFWAGLL